MDWVQITLVALIGWCVIEGARRSALEVYESRLRRAERQLWERAIPQMARKEGENK